MHLELWIFQNPEEMRIRLFVLAVVRESKQIVQVLEQQLRLPQVMIFVRLVDWQSAEHLTEIDLLEELTRFPVVFVAYL
jgi:hypothetical protein